MPATITVTPVAEIAGDWWIPFLRGIIAILFGLVAIVLPGLTLAMLLGAFAVFATIDGVLSIMTGWKRRATDSRWWAWMLEGALSLAIAAMALFWPQATALAFVFWMAAWAIVAGVMRIIAAISLRREIEGEWALGLSGVLSILLGALLLAMPGAGLLSIAWMVGTLAVLFGVAMVMLGLRLRRLR